MKDRLILIALEENNRNREPAWNRLRRKFVRHILRVDGAVRHRETGAPSANSLLTRMPNLIGSTFYIPARDAMCSLSAWSSTSKDGSPLPLETRHREEIPRQKRRSTQLVMRQRSRPLFCLT